jgi:small multidrug resistance pump/quaternary ammonium compound-resistance protein SugE
MLLALGALSAVLFTVGGIFMKQADGLRNGSATALFLLMFMAGAAALSCAMRREELATTWVIVLGIEAALAVVFGTLIFAEPLTLQKAGAIGLIVAGIALARAA